MSDVVDVAIVGAGPYGLSLAAHLRGTGLEVRHFGLPMRLWREAMPQGMFLKSQGFASNLSDPEGTHTLEKFCQATGREYRSYGLPVSLGTFISYGQWFQRELVPGIEEVLVTRLAGEGGQFRIQLADGGQLEAGNVVVAAGVEHFGHVAAPLSGLPATACTHSSRHSDLNAFAGQRVIVVGAGQSALESAALLHEGGASVQLVARADRIVWNGQPLPPDRPLIKQLREPESGLGSGWSTWFYSTRPGLYRYLPRPARVSRARTALGPAGASWLRDRVEGRFAVRTGLRVQRAEERDGTVCLELASRDGSVSRVTADHVIAATGYRPDLQSLPFLGAKLRSGLRTVAGTPDTGADYQSSVRGLFFVGPAVAPTFGPVMRFVYGADHAARTVSRRIASAPRISGSRQPTAAAERR